MLTPDGETVSFVYYTLPQCQDTMLSSGIGRRPQNGRVIFSDVVVDPEIQ